MTVPTLLDSLIRIIRLKPGCTVQEIRSQLLKHEQLRVTRHAVNSILYSNKSLFKPDDEYIPRWFSVGAPAPVRPASRRGLRPATPSIARAGLYAWQREALRKWESDGHVGVVEAVTGAGKTRVGLVAATEELMRGGKVLVLV